MKRILFASLFSLFVSPAFAATCPVSSAQLKANDGTTFTVAVVDSGDGSGQCWMVNKVGNANNNGQAAGANSSPVVLSSDYIGNVPLANVVYGTTTSMTGTTSTQLLAAVSTKTISTVHLSCVNSSATGTLVSVQDGSGGTILGTVTAAPNFGGHEENNNFPLFPPTSAGNGLYVANVTTGAAVICTATGWHN